MAEIKKGDFVILHDIKSENGDVIKSDLYEVQRFVDDFIIVKNMINGDEISITESMVKKVVQNKTEIGEKGTVKFNHDGESFEEISGVDDANVVYDKTLRESVAVSLLKIGLDNKDIAHLVAVVSGGFIGKEFNSVSEFVEYIVNEMDDDTIYIAMDALTVFIRRLLEKKKLNEITDMIDGILSELKTKSDQ